ncbi:MAG: hypothetical protein AB8B56_11905 [Crocinitomicaceae bacterium]
MKHVITAIILLISLLFSCTPSSSDGDEPIIEDDVLIIKTDTATLFIQMTNSDGNSRGFIKNDTLEITVDYTDALKSIANQITLNIDIDNENCEVWRVSNEKHRIYLDSNYTEDNIAMDFMISSTDKKIGSTRTNKKGKVIDTFFLDPFPLTRKIRAVQQD